MIAIEVWWIARQTPAKQYALACYPMVVVNAVCCVNLQRFAAGPFYSTRMPCAWR